jgi:hypothetical protein
MAQMLRSAVIPVSFDLIFVDGDVPRNPWLVCRGFPICVSPPQRKPHSEGIEPPAEVTGNEFRQ